MPTLHTLTLAVIAAFTLAGAAQAQQKATTDFVRTAIEDGVSASSADRETAQYIASGEYWSGGVINWYYNPANQPAYLTTNEVMSAIYVAAARWAQMCNLTFNYLGTSTASRNFQGSAVDRVNVIGWDSFPFSLWDASGITYWNYSRTTLNMVDADIFLNTREKWTSAM